MSEQHGQQKAPPAEHERSGCCGGHPRDTAAASAPAKDERKPAAPKQGCCH